MKRADYRTMDEDEQLIRKSFRDGLFINTAALVGLVGAAWWYDRNLFPLVAVGAVLLLLNEIAGRLFDVSVRISRTNELLVDGRPERRYRTSDPADRS
jgi:hypothetical protein